MIGTKLGRGRDTALAIYYLLRVQALYRRGNGAVTRATNAAMRRTAATKEELDATGLETWHVARSVWRAKTLLPMHSTCLQTALATQMLFARKGVSSALRVGVASTETDAHAWVEVGDFILDDQRIAHRFAAFDVSANGVTRGEA